MRLMNLPGEKQSPSLHEAGQSTTADNANMMETGLQDEADSTLWLLSETPAPRAKC
jgi:hypothetical protein